MLVESRIERSPKKGSAVPKASDVRLRKEFVDALARNEKASDVANRLGISLSTYYKWRARAHEHGTAWLEGRQATKAKRLPGQSVTATEELIVQLSLENPFYGAAHLARLLTEQWDFPISTGTIHAILKARGISTRQSRAQALVEQRRTPGTLTRVQLKAVQEVSPFAAWPRGKEAEAGLTLIHGQVPIPHTSPLGSCRLMVIVDAHDQRAFAKFPVYPTDSPERDFIQEVTDWYKGTGIEVKQVITNSCYEFRHSCQGRFYDIFLKSRGIAHRFETSRTCGLRLNPLIKDVWTSLKAYLFIENRSVCLAAQNELSKLNPIIQAFLNRTFGDG